MQAFDGFIEWMDEETWPVGGDRITQEGRHRDRETGASEREQQETKLSHSRVKREKRGRGYGVGFKGTVSTWVEEASCTQVC